MKIVRSYLKLHKSLCFVLCTLYFILASCGKTYEGFKEVEKGVFEKVINIGDDQKTAQSGHYLKISYALYSYPEQIPFLLDTGVYLLLEKPYEDDFQKALSHMNLDDSAHFIIHRADPTKNDSVCDIILAINLRKILTKPQYEQAIHEMEMRSEELEAKEILAYLNDHKKENWEKKQGIYYIEMTPGSGNYIQSKETVEIHYKGSFFDGTIFDSTYDRNNPMEFTYGDPQQVIPGIDIALKSMKKGTKAKIIIPSLLGFGENGTIDKTIRPYTPLIYEVEVINVKKNNL